MADVPSDLSQWSAAFWRVLLDTVHAGVVVTDASERILYANATFCHDSGLTLAQVLGRRPGELGALEADGQGIQDINVRLQRGEHVTFEGRIRHGGRGAATWFRMHIDSLRAADGQVSHHVSTNVQIEALMQTQQHLQALSRRDDLTQALNRRAFVADLDGWATCTLVVLDLNAFKAVNDRFGHAAGDALLGGLARALLAAGGVADRVYRLGGDEFAWVLDGDQAEEQLAVRLAGVVASLRADADAGSGRAVSDLAWGAARRPHDAGDLDGLYRLADRRMYLHKHGPARQLTGR